MGISPSARGDNEEFEKSTNFMAYPMGQNGVKFKALAYSEGGYNHWAYNEPGYSGGAVSIIQYSILDDKGKEGAWTDLAQWWSDNNNDDSYGHVNLMVLPGEDNCHGSFVIDNDRANPDRYCVADGSTIWYRANYVYTTRNCIFTEFTWHPALNSKLSGKKIKIRFLVRQRKVNWHESYTYQVTGSISLGGVIETPKLYTPVFYPLSTDKAKVMVPYSTTVTPTQYIASNDKDKKKVEISNRAGTIYVDAEDTIQRGFYLTMTLQDDQSGTIDMPSTQVDIPAYHEIHDFKVEPNITYTKNKKPYYDGSKKISWTIKNFADGDAVPSETFQLQRAYKSDFSDAVTIATIPASFQEYGSNNGESATEDTENKKNYEKTDSTYTYEDTSVDAYVNALDQDAPIYYRVRRTSAVQMGWEGNPYSAKQSIFAPVYVPVLYANYYTIQAKSPATTVELDKDYTKNHKVHFTVPIGIDYTQKGTPEKRYMVWNQTIRLKVVRSNLTSGMDKEFYVPQDSIQYVDADCADGANSYWVASFTDSPDVACSTFRYSVEVDTTYSNIAKIHDASIGEYKSLVIPVDTKYEAFYYDEATEISNFAATQGTNSECTMLTWGQEGACADYYILERRQAGSDGVWDKIAEDIEVLFYKDATAAPGVMYEYKLTAVVDCNGVNKKEATTTGFRSPYATITGKVQFSNGISQPGVKVVLQRNSKSSKGTYYTMPDGTASIEPKNTYTATTAEDGTFVFENIPYTDQGSSFTVIPTDEHAVFSYNGSTSDAKAQISIDNGHSTYTGIVFENTSYVKLSGRVLFEKSTVPVHNAHFTVDGKVVTSATGAVVLTDASGDFEITVPKSKDVCIKAVMEGHTFANDGLITTEKGATTITLNDNLPSVRVYDQTKVTLIGRVVGGNTQGDKPLGFGLSKNNLGDNLQFVMQLEGDNISSLLYDPNDLTYKADSTYFAHPVEGQQTKMKIADNRITVTPDPVTGEYIVKLFPVKYKITQATAKGYPTLFNNGEGIKTIDLTEALTTKTLKNEKNDKMTLDYNETFNLIHRNSAVVTCDQYTYGVASEFYGEPSFTKTDILGNTTTIPTYSKDANGKAIRDENGNVKYIFGYPIFASGYSYTFRVSAHEDYYYNNVSTGILDQVLLAYNPIKIHNGFSAEEPTAEATLDEKAEAIVVLPVDNPYFAVEGDNALRTLDVSVAIDGEYVKATDIQAFVTGYKSKGRDYQTELGSQIDLNYVLRDPPGTESYAYIKQGSTFATHYEVNTSLKLGMEIDVTMGDAYQQVAGMVTGANTGTGTFAGIAMEGASDKKTEIPLVYTQTGNKEYNYSFTLDDEVQTGDDACHVGNNANVFVGTETAAYCNRNESFTVVDEAVYNHLAPSIQAGTVKDVASGTDADGNKYHLVVAEELSFTVGNKSTFYYSQDHIINQIIPRLQAERKSLIHVGTEKELQPLANKLGRPVYRSTTENPDSFGIPGTYVPVNPEPGYINSAYPMDEVEEITKIIHQWINILIGAERAVVEGSPSASYLGTYSFDGGHTITHEESAEVSMGLQDKQDSTPTSDKIASSTVNFGTNALSTGTSELYKALYKTYMNWGDHGNSILAGLINNESLFDTYNNEKDKWTTTDAIKGTTSSWDFSFNFKPIAEYTTTASNHFDLTNTYTTGFVLKENDDSYLNVSVYRVVSNFYSEDQNANWRQQALDSYADKMNTNSSTYVCDYVYQINAGATRCPYIGEETTQFYLPGTRMNPATLQIDRAAMEVDTHEINDVPENGVAKFNLKLWNESETIGEEYFYEDDYVLKYEDTSNPNGLQLFVDGTNILNGVKFRLSRGQIINKVLEARCGTGYDYDDVELLFIPECDYECMNYDCASRVKISVHFVPTAGDVALSSPRANWTMNTLSQHDSEGYYIPVTINGYDTNYKNFDHIELQYKLSDESDDAWVNLCSFYADADLYNRASGTKMDISDMNGTINYAFYGERDPMEQKYDLRAVDFCRYGSSYVTKSSEVLSGVKDTRCPKVFGYAEPADGILGIGDVLSIPFSEDIAGQYLDEDANFQVVGYTNSTTVNSSTSLQFTDNSADCAKSYVTRNLKGKDFSVDLEILPDVKNKKMTYFSHGSYGSYVEFGQTDDNRLYAAMSGSSKVAYSKTLDNITAFTRVVMTYNHSTGAVKFYEGTLDVTGDNCTLAKNYSGVGEINLGAALNNKSPYIGRMVETRLWSRELSADDVAATYNKVLTGYERKLLAYYPMDEGEGSEIKDKANGATIQLNGQTWNNPVGRSVGFTGKDGLQLNGKIFTRSNTADYTLGFWFKTDKEYVLKDSVAIFASGRGAKDELTPDGKMFIGFYGDKFVIQNEGRLMNISGDYDDTKWHHFIMSVNRSRNTAAVFMDDAEISEFDSDSITGIYSDDIYLGACHWNMVNGNGERIPHSGYLFNGYIDDVTLWETALPKSYIDAVKNQAPTGEELGLLCYLPFSTSQTNQNSIYVPDYSPYNSKVYYDDDHKKVDKKERLILTDDATAKKLLSSVSAPITETKGLTKMKFSWMSRDNELLISLDMLDKEINKNNVFLTVRDVKDLHGNLLKDPVTWTVFVDRSQLKWSDKKVTLNTAYDTADYFTADIENICGTQTTYKIEGLPDWLTLKNSATGTIQPESDLTLKFDVDKNLDPGEHTTIIYVTDQNELSEPLYITVNVTKDAPSWAYNTGSSETMNVFATVKISDVDGNTYYDTDTEDIVGAFVNGTCVGLQNISFDNNTNTNGLYMTLHGDKKMDKQKVVFRLWRASSGEIYSLSANPSVKFEAESFSGSPDNRVVLTTDASGLQSISLNGGWNWISFNIKPSRDGDDFTGSFASEYEFDDHDYIKTDRKYAEYDATNKIWSGSLDYFENNLSYMVKVEKMGTLEVIGSALTTDLDRTVTLKKGWNYLPYLNSETQPIATALASYYDDAQANDVVKSYDEFAMMDQNKQWQGSLTHLRPGKGYMLFRNGSKASSVTFYNATSKKSEEESGDTGDSAKRRTSGQYSDNMPIVATVNIGSLDESLATRSATSQTGLTLRAYSGSELIGETSQSADGNFYIMTSALAGSDISFECVDEAGNVIGTTSPLLSYNSATSIGTVESPFVIDFASQGVSARPTVFTDKVLFQAATNPGDAVDIRIYDAAGTLDWSHSGHADGSIYTFHATDLMKLAGGMHVAHITVAGKEYNVKLIKK